MLDIVPQRYTDDISRCEAPIDEMRGASLDHRVEIAVPNDPLAMHDRRPVATCAGMLS